LFPLFAKNYYWTWGIAGKTLKSTSGWKKQGNGTDDYEFSALPGGYRNGYGLIHNTNSRFDAAGYFGRWWTSKRYWYYGMNYGDSDLDDIEGGKDDG
jgi:uncharacterized protein (TIGR02145 family)